MGKGTPSGERQGSRVNTDRWGPSSAVAISSHHAMVSEPPGAPSPHRYLWSGQELINGSAHSRAQYTGIVVTGTCLCLLGVHTGMESLHAGSVYGVRGSLLSVMEKHWIRSEGPGPE